MVTSEAGVAGGRTPGRKARRLETSGAIGMATRKRSAEHWRSVAAPHRQHTRSGHAVAIILPCRGGHDTRGLCVLLGEIFLDIVRENIAQDQIGHAFGSKRFKGTLHKNVYGIDCPNKCCPIRVYYVVIIPLISHGSLSACS